MVLKNKLINTKINKFDKNRIFKKVSDHLLKQNERSEKDQDCRYKLNRAGDTELKCSIGILIPDSKYKRSLEGLPITDEKVFNSLEFRVTGQDQVDFLFDLQQIHDQYNCDEWKRELDKIKIKYGLEK